MPQISISSIFLQITCSPIVRAPVLRSTRSSQGVRAPEQFQISRYYSIIPSPFPTLSHKTDLRKVLSNTLPNNSIKGGAARLKPTIGVRSPGGTPARQKRRLSLTDNADIITQALRNKFRSVQANTSFPCYSPELSMVKDVTNEDSQMSTPVLCRPMKTATPKTANKVPFKEALVPLLLSLQPLPRMLIITPT